MNHRRSLTWLVSASLLACSEGAGPGFGPPRGDGGAPPAQGGAGGSFDVPPPSPPCPDAPSCAAGHETNPRGRGLVIQDPEILAELSLHAVLGAVIENGKADLVVPQGSGVTPHALITTLFDALSASPSAATADAIHCDELPNQTGFDTLACPRAEGDWAFVGGFTTPGDPNELVPVAFLSRFDLVPNTLDRCGEYRIVYAKRSGLDDPSQRAFVIVEASLTNPIPGCLEACRPAAELLDELDAAPDAEAAKAALLPFLFHGARGFRPVLHPLHLGLGAADGQYGSGGGQVRLAAFGQAPWTYREFVFDQTQTATRFRPVRVKGTLAPWFFADAAGAFGSMAGSLATDDVTALGLLPFEPQAQPLESSPDGPSSSDYAALAAGSQLASGALAPLLPNLSKQACGHPDALTADDVLRRATVTSCAGCHLPTAMLGRDRDLGCGMTFPASHEGPHVDERGALSPALRDVFLPHRARVLDTFLDACDWDAIQSSLVVVPPFSDLPIQPAEQPMGGALRVH